MRQLNDFLAFFKKNRYVIYVLIGIALMMQVCSTGTKTTIGDKQIAKETIAPIVQHSTRDIETPQQKKHEPQVDFNTLLLMLVVVLFFFVAKKYGWLEKLMPQIVVFRVSYHKRKADGHIVMKIQLINRTKRDISFQPPVIQFNKGKDKREFAIKNIGGQNYFPLTLMPGTGQRFTIDAQKFYDRVDGLDAYKTISMHICSTSGATYKSIKKPIWLIFKKL